MKFRYLNLLLVLSIFIIACNPDDEGVMQECDDQNITYNNGAATILNSSCALAGCHASGTTTTFAMGNYSEALIAAGFGRIIGAINHDPGFSPMPNPTGTPQLDQCAIDRLTGWINDGAPE